jgi:hypothetical protein
VHRLSLWADGAGGDKYVKDVVPVKVGKPQKAMKSEAVKSWMRGAGFRIIGACLFSVVVITYKLVTSHYGWVSFSSTEGGFEMQFPAKPEQETITGRMNDPRFQNAVLLVVQKDKIGYSAGWGDDFADDAANYSIEERLDAARDGLLKTTQGNFISELKITSSGVPGREVVFLANGVRSRARIYVTGSRRYSMMVISDYGSPNATRFFESFHLLNR